MSISFKIENFTSDWAAINGGGLTWSTDRDIAVRFSEFGT